jgi:hypothetical protein
MIQQRAITAALIALAFAAGAGIGVAVDRGLAPAPTVQARVIRDMSVVLDSLGLSAEQRVQAQAIVEASAPRTEEAMREAADRLRSVAESVDTELRAILTPEQRIRLDELRRQPVFMIKRKAPGGGTTVDTVLRRPPER